MKDVIIAYLEEGTGFNRRRLKGESNVMFNKYVNVVKIEIAC